MPVIPFPASQNALPDLAPVGRSTLNRQAYASLREGLMAGRFRPGQPVTFRAVAQALGISRQPVLEALKRLEAEGALVASPTSGTLFVPLLDRPGLDELLDIRVHLEGLAAERAARRATEEEVEEVRALAATMQERAEAGDREGYVAANWAFHSGLYRSSHSPMLLAAIEPFWLRIGPYVARMMPDRERLLASMPAHHDAIAAVAARKPRAARLAITRDIRDSAVTLAQTLDGAPSR